MKYAILLAFLSVSLFSCVKEPVTVPPLAKDSVLIGYILYNPITKTKISEAIAYNLAKQLTMITSATYDTSSGTPAWDSLIVTMAAVDAATLPPNYDANYYSPGYPTGGLTDHHELKYDGESRVIRDSITTSTYSSHVVQHIFYDGLGNTTIESSTANVSTPEDYVLTQVDTLLIQDENIQTDIIYKEPENEFTFLKTITYGSQSNPLYNDKLSKSIGCLGVFRGLGEYRSRSLPGWARYEIPPTPNLELFYTWTADNTGRIVKGVGKDAGGSVGEIYTYIYSYN